MRIIILSHLQESRRGSANEHLSGIYSYKGWPSRVNQLVLTINTMENVLASVRSYRSGREQAYYVAAEKRTASSDQTLSILQQSNAIAAEK